ncbi:MAG: hypothetical protein E7456_04340 [Ruminococcaceae bacterium]|nr:hypothetical protein [Oscillospiraceae bacterium]
MKLKKLTALLLICVLALAALTGCSEEDIGGEWYRDAKEHWHVNENGKKKNVADHDLVDNVCTVCDSEVLIYDDGSADIYNYTENGDYSKLTSYDAEGNLTLDTRYEYEYDDRGYVTKSSQYEFDVLVQEIEYVISFEGESTMALQVFYSEDGSKNIHECDGLGHVTKEIYCDPNGWEKVLAEHFYSQGSDGQFYTSTDITYLDDGTYFIHDYNEQGDILRWYTFDAYGSLASDIYYSYEYDEEGNMLRSTKSDGSWLTNEYEYSLDSDGNSYCSLEIVYSENETTTQYEYDENGEIINEVTFDYSGNMI